MRVTVGGGDSSYLWIEDWARIDGDAAVGWAHHGLAVTKDGTIIAAIAADGGGNLYIAEWLIGGRITKLAPLAPDGSSAAP